MTRGLGLVKLRADTHRGLRGRAERGLEADGTTYGVPHRAEQADVVCRIFDLYAQGDGLRAIAHRLNAEGVAPPRPRKECREAALVDGELAPCAPAK